MSSELRLLGICFVNFFLFLFLNYFLPLKRGCFFPKLQSQLWKVTVHHNILQLARWWGGGVTSSVCMVEHMRGQLDEGNDGYATSKLLVPRRKSPVFKATDPERTRKMGTLCVNIFYYESRRGTAI